MQVHVISRSERTGAAATNSIHLARWNDSQLQSTRKANLVYPGDGTVLEADLRL